MVTDGAGRLKGGGYTELYTVYFDPQAASLPYGNETEYWSDLLASLDMRLAVLTVWRSKHEETGALIPWQSAREMALSPEKAMFFLNKGRLVDLSSGDGGAEETQRRIRSELSLAASHIMNRLSRTPGAGNSFVLRRLYRMFSLSKLEQFLFLMGAAARMDARYESLYMDIQGGNRTSPTLQLAFALYELTDSISQEERAALGQRRGRFFAYLADWDGGNLPAFSETFRVSDRLWSFLMGDGKLPRFLERMAVLKQPDEDPGPVLIRGEQVEQIRRFVEAYGDNLLEDTAGAVSGPDGSSIASAGESRVLHIYGEAGLGRHFAVQKGASQAGKAVLFVDITPLFEKNVDFDALVRSLKRELLLADAVPCFVETGVREEEADEQEEIRGPKPFPEDLDRLLKILCGELGFFIWMSLERAGYLTRYPLHFLAMEFPMLTIGERLALWRAFSQGVPLEEGVELAVFANQYILTARGIRESLIRADMMRAGRGEARIGPDVLKEAVRQQSVNQLGRFATLINAVFTWDDLVIDPEQKRQMQMICSQVRCRSVVGEDWGFHKKTPYGRGICALLYGSPGTGKTMAVQVMANELGLDLYRIDLSQMVSKYIGETEKNISALFRKARNLNAVLFFDEADSMFAKRSEVKDSNDRNANAETAHLLQKLEDYSGITFLATNYVNNIDDAFKRRIKFMIHFVFPGEDVRLTLWKRILPPEAQLEEELDLEFFARNFELAGSNIKEVLTNAAYMAAAEHRGLANRDVVEAIRLNFAKYGKILTMDDFGYLGK